MYPGLKTYTINKLINDLKNMGHKLKHTHYEPTSGGVQDAEWRKDCPQIRQTAYKFFVFMKMFQVIILN